MMTTGIFQTKTEVQGFPALTFTNGSISLTIVPELGGKISSLRDLRNGREWLWTSPTLPYSRQPYGASYIQKADVGGWDECFPTVGNCQYPLDPWKGIALPDHGEIWSSPWGVEIHEDGQSCTIHTTIKGTALDYEFRRSVTITAGSPDLLVEYSAKNISDADLAAIWSIHPIIAIEPGMQLILPEGAKMHCWSSEPADLLSNTDTFSWPMKIPFNGQEWSLTKIPDRAGFALKLWSEPLIPGQGYAAVAASDGELRFTFDTDQVTQIGAWMNYGGWSGTGGQNYYNLALEPCFGAQDSLEVAIKEYSQFATIPANGIRYWSLRIHLSSKS